MFRRELSYISLTVCDHYQNCLETKLRSLR